MIQSQYKNNHTKDPCKTQAANHCHERYTCPFEQSGAVVEKANYSKCKKLLQEQYAREINFLSQLPTILDMDSYIFVHGGIPTDDLESLTETDQHNWLKNDRFP